MPESPVAGFPPAASAASIVLAFDFGRRRIGVATGNTVTRSAAPAGVIPVEHGEPRWSAIETLLRELRPRLAVVGLPYNADGSESEMTGAARGFAQELSRRFGIDIALVDERYSSIEAADGLRAARQAGLKRRRVVKADIDAGAACVILNRWLGGQRA